jgi:hypothetical protein
MLQADGRKSYNLVAKEAEKALMIFDQKWNEASNSETSEVERYEKIFSQLVSRTFAPLKVRPNKNKNNRKPIILAEDLRKESKRALMRFRRKRSDERLRRYVKVRKEYKEKRIQELKEAENERKNQLTEMRKTKDWRNLWI